MKKTTNVDYASVLLMAVISGGTAFISHSTLSLFFNERDRGEIEIGYQVYIEEVKDLNPDSDYQLMFDKVCTLPIYSKGKIDNFFVTAPTVPVASGMLTRITVRAQPHAVEWPEEPITVTNIFGDGGGKIQLDYVGPPPQLHTSAIGEVWNCPWLLGPVPAEKLPIGAEVCGPNRFPIGYSDVAKDLAGNRFPNGGYLCMDKPKPQQQQAF